MNEQNSENEYDLCIVPDDDDNDDTCEECGYQDHGIEQGAACPNCGHTNGQQDSD